MVTEDDFVVVKLDVEGSEYAVLPHLLSTRVLCDGVEWVVAQGEHNAARDSGWARASSFHAFGSQQSSSPGITL